VGEFFQTGADEVAAAVDYVTSLGVTPSRKRALDFGCGVGRLTQALANYFNEVYGVDIAPSMLELARRYNRQGDKCKFVLNEVDDLRQFTDGYFDFIYTSIVLQHMEPAFSKNYIREFMRVSAPGGIVLFDVPSEPAPRQTGVAVEKGPLALGKRGLARTIGLATGRLLSWFSRAATSGQNKPPPSRRELPVDDNDKGPQLMGLYGIRRKEVEHLLGECGARMVDISPDQSAAPYWSGFRYCDTKVGADALLQSGVRPQPLHSGPSGPR
jgi:SAM-dependent methyltransferase